jgi:serine/threonine protein kinase
LAAYNIFLITLGAAIGIDDCKDPTERTVVAVKTLKKDCNESSKEEFNQEVAFMSVLDHPNVVQMLAVATEEEPYCMIFEFMELGDLNQFLRKIKPIDDSEEVPGKQCNQKHLSCNILYLPFS